MSTINDSDLLLVERNGNLHQITYDQMSTLNDDDILLVERGGVQYKVEAQYISAGANGLIIPPVEVLTPINGAGITEFDQYEPLSSAITAVGEAGTIAKETDEILSVVDEAPIVSWDIADGSNPSFAGTDINFATELAAKGVTAITGINLYLDDVSGYPYTSSLAGFTLNNVDLVAAAQISLTEYNGTPYNSNYSWVSFFNGGGYNQCQGSTTYTCRFQAYSLGTVAKLKVLSVGGRVSLLDQNGVEHFIIGSSGSKVLSFPTNTNFSGLSVGDLLQGGTVESPVMIATSTLGGTDFVVENFETADTTSINNQVPSTFDHASRVKHLCFYLSDATSDIQVNMGGSGWNTYSSVDGVNWVQGTTLGSGSAMVRTLSSNNPSAKYFLIGGLTSGDVYYSWATFKFQTSFINNWNPPYTLEMPVGGSISPAVEITAIDASGPSQTEEYATFAPDSFNANQGTMTNGNLTLNASGAYYIEGRSTLDVFSSDNYSELTVTSASGIDSFAYGIGDADTWIISGVGSYFIYRENGTIISYPGNTTVATVDSYTQGDVLGMAVDSTNVKFYKNGALQGTYAHGKSGTFYVYAMNVPNTGSAQLDINFGATAFTHTPPSGYAGLSETVTTYPNVTVDGGDWDTSNQSEVWSSGLTTPSNSFNGGQPATSAFDGDLSTFAGAGSIGEDIVFQPTTPVSYTDSIEIYTAQAGQMILNSDSPVATTDATGWVTLVSGSSGSINTITIDPNSNRRATLHAIRVDGQLLVDAIEDSQVWSDLVVGTLDSQYGNSDVTVPFDGTPGSDPSDGIRPAGSGNYLSMDFGTTFANATTLKIYGNTSLDGVTYTGTNENLEINGVPLTASEWADNGGSYGYSSATFTLSNGLTSLRWGYGSGSQSSGYIYLLGIEVDGKLLIDAGVRDLGDRKLTSSISYEKSLTFTDDTQLANMVGPLEMTDANGDVVTPVSDTIANVSGNVLTLQGDTNLAYFQPGDEVQTGVQVVSVDAAAPSITVDGGSWYGADGTGGTYEISKSLRFNSADSAYLSRAVSTPGNRRTWTWSGWIKKDVGQTGGIFCSGTSNSAINYIALAYNNTDTITVVDYSGSFNYFLETTSVYRDPSAWQHIVVAFDSTQSTNSDRIKIYVNGVRQTAVGSPTWPAPNFQGNINATDTMGLGTSYANSGNYDGYLADVHFVDGQALAPTAFGDFDSNGVWQAKEADISSYGTNGFHLDFSDSSSDAALGANAATNDYATTVGAVTTSYPDFYAGALYPPKNLFNGIATNASIVYGGYSNADGVSGNSDIIWTPNGAYSVSSSLRVFAGYYSNISVNGVSLATGASQTAETWVTLAHTGPITSIKFENLVDDYAVRAAAIEIDGTILTTTAWDVNNLTAAGSAWNQSQTWSGQVSGTEYGGSYTKTAAFDGTISSSVTLPADGNQLVFTPSPSFSNATSVKIYYYYPTAHADAFKLNGTSVSSSLSTTGGTNNYTFDVTGTGFTSLAWSRNYHGSEDTGIYAIEVDGVLLVDSTVADPQAVNIDSLVDTPTNYGDDTGAGGEVRGNYCTWNPLSATGATLTNGNLEATLTAGGYGRESVRGTLAVSSGKYYWEEFLSDTGNQSGFYGVVGASTQSNIRLDAATSGTNAVLYAAWNGNKAINGVSTAYGEGFTTGDIIGVALDLDNGTITFYKNGSSQGSITLPDTGIAYTPTFVWNGASSSGTTKTNWGARPFAFAVPSGYKALCTTNLPEPTIKDGSKHFDVVTYTGNGSTQTISGLGFSPDLVWLKSSSHALNHRLVDSVQGVTSTLSSNLSYAAHDSSSEFTDLTSDGFSVTQGNSFVLNASGYEYVAWCWNAGDTTVTNYDGDITSQVRANPAAGFSIVSYSSASSAVTVGHGLNAAPKLVIVKDRNAAQNWVVITTLLANTTDYSYLNTTNAFANFGVTAPTTTTFKPAQSPNSDYIAYCFAPVEGYSAMGSYIGTGTSDNSAPFVYTGFKPSFLLIKNTGGDDWYIFDNERPSTKPLFANGNYAEQPDNREVEFLSNGFKIRYNQFFNASGAEMIYMAFAENPLNTPPEVDTSGDTQVALDPLAAIATDILEIDGTTMYLNGATGPWRTGLSIEGSQINADPPGPSEITFTSQNQGTPAFSGVDATLASRTWTLESGTTATGPWTLVDTYSDFGVLNTQTGATPWTENKPTLQPNTYYRIKVQYNSTNAESVESVYNTFKTGDA